MHAESLNQLTWRIIKGNLQALQLHNGKKTKQNIFFGDQINIFFKVAMLFSCINIEYGLSMRHDGFQLHCFYV